MFCKYGNYRRHQNFEPSWDGEVAKMKALNFKMKMSLIFSIREIFRNWSGRRGLLGLVLDGIL